MSFNCTLNKKKTKMMVKSLNKIFTFWFFYLRFNLLMLLGILFQFIFLHINSQMNFGKYRNHKSLNGHISPISCSVVDGNSYGAKSTCVKERPTHPAFDNRRLFFQCLHPTQTTYKPNLMVKERDIYVKRSVLVSSKSCSFSTSWPRPHLIFGRSKIGIHLFWQSSQSFVLIFVKRVVSFTIIFQLKRVAFYTNLWPSGPNWIDIAVLSFFDVISSPWFLASPKRITPLCPVFSAERESRK